MEQQLDVLSTELTVNSLSMENLLSSAKWAKFLAIVGFIFCGIMGLGGVFLGQFIANNSAFGPARGMGGMFTVIYLIIAVLMFFPCLYLYKFSTQMIDAANNNRQENFDTAMVNLKAMFKFYGIITIVILSLYALAFLFGIMGGMMR